MVAAVVLSGCMKMEMGVDIRSDDDIRIKMMVGVERDAAAAMAEGGQEMTAEDLCGQAGSDSGVPDATVKDLSDDEYIACEMSGTTDLESMADSLQHADGEYTFVMASGEGDSSADLGAEVFDSFKISVTFPGDVMEHNGSSTVDGSTVTWTDPDDLYGPDGLRAVGEDEASSSVWLWIVLASIVVLVVVAVVVLLLVLRSQRRKRTVQPYLPPTGLPVPGPPPGGSQPGPPLPGEPQPGPPLPGQPQPGPPLPGQPHPGPPLPGQPQPGAPLPGQPEQPPWTQPGQQPPPPAADSQ